MVQRNVQLTEEVVGPARPRRVWATLALTLALVALADVAVCALRDDHSTNRAYWLVREKWKLLTELDAPVDFLILGDSSGNQESFWRTRSVWERHSSHWRLHTPRQ